MKWWMNKNNNGCIIKVDFWLESPSYKLNYSNIAFAFIDCNYSSTSLSSLSLFTTTIKPLLPSYVFITYIIIISSLFKGLNPPTGVLRPYSYGDAPPDANHFHILIFFKNATISHTEFWKFAPLPHTLYIPVNYLRHLQK